MIQSRHCSLCDNEIRSLEKGVTCKLTNKKPDFKKACSDIVLHDKFLSKLEDANLELEKIRSVSNRAHWTLYVLIILGILLIIGNKTLTDVVQDLNYYWVYRVGIIAIGITILTNAFNGVIKFKNNLKNKVLEKNKIDSVLKIYGISYKIKFEYKKEIHENQNIKVIIDFKNWIKKRTSTIYKITP